MNHLEKKLLIHNFDLLSSIKNSNKVKISTCGKYILTLYKTNKLFHIDQYIFNNDNKMILKKQIKEPNKIQFIFSYNGNILYTTQYNLILSNKFKIKFKNIIDKCCKSYNYILIHIQKELYIYDINKIKTPLLHSKDISINLISLSNKFMFYTRNNNDIVIYKRLNNEKWKYSRTISNKKHIDNISSNNSIFIFSSKGKIYYTNVTKKTLIFNSIKISNIYNNKLYPLLLNNILIIGAPYENNKNGSIYIYIYIDKKWRKKNILPTENYKNMFGINISSNINGDKIIVSNLTTSFIYLLS